MRVPSASHQQLPCVATANILHSLPSQNKENKRNFIIEWYASALYKELRVSGCKEQDYSVFSELLKFILYSIFSTIILSFYLNLQDIVIPYLIFSILLFCILYIFTLFLFFIFESNSFNLHHKNENLKNTLSWMLYTQCNLNSWCGARVMQKSQSTITKQPRPPHLPPAVRWIVFYIFIRGERGVWDDMRVT